MRNILALDLGTKTGWAMLRYGEIVSGTINLKETRYSGGGARYLRLRRWLRETYEETPFAELWFEEVRSHRGVDAAHVYGGMLAMITAWAEERGIPYQGIPVGTWKKHACGKGNVGKAEVMKTFRLAGYNPADDNEADALGILYCALEKEVVPV